MTIKEFFSGKGNLAIHCDTTEKARKLLKAFDKAGYRWAAGSSYVKNTNWATYREETCYIDDGCFGSVEYCREYDYTILEFDEIELEDASEEKEEKGPQSMKEEKKAIEETLKKCASFFGITNCGNSVCTYTYEYGANKITLYTDKPGLWIGYHSNSSTILRAALSTALHRDNVEVAFIELKGIMAGSIKIGE